MGTNEDYVGHVVDALEAVRLFVERKPVGYRWKEGSDRQVHKLDGAPVGILRDDRFEFISLYKV